MGALNALYNFIVTLKKGQKKDKSTADRNATVSKYVSLHVFSEFAIKWILHRISKVAFESFKINDCEIISKGSFQEFRFRLNKHFKNTHGIV